MNTRKSCWRDRFAVDIVVFQSQDHQVGVSVVVWITDAFIRNTPEKHNNSKKPFMASTENMSIHETVTFSKPSHSTRQRRVVWFSAAVISYSTSPPTFSFECFQEKRAKFYNPDLIKTILWYSSSWWRWMNIDFCYTLGSFLHWKESLVGREVLVLTWSCYCSV